MRNQIKKAPWAFKQLLLKYLVNERANRRRPLKYNR